MIEVDPRYPQAVLTATDSFRKDLPLLWLHNQRSIQDGVFKERILEEIDEAQEAQEALDSARTLEQQQRNTEKLADELNDVLVLLSPVILTVFPDWLSVSNQIYSVNGDGRHSNVYERMKEVVGEVEEGKNFTQLVALLQSVDSHLPVPHAAVHSIQLTLEKVHGNYPPELMQPYDEEGVLLSEEAQQKKFAFLCKALRMIRDRVKRLEGERPLEQSDWQQLAMVLKNGYEQPHTALQIIASYLQHEQQDRETSTIQLKPNIVTPIPVPAQYRLD